jgi:hypothetical protein
MSPLHRRLHNQLVDIAVASATTGRFGTLSRLLNEIDDPKMLSQIRLWILTYSALTEHQTEPGKFVYSREARRRFDKDRAVSNPFWLLGARGNAPSPSESARTSNVPRGKRRSGSDAAVSEQDIAKQHLRSALTRFMTHPTFANRENLHALVVEYQTQYLLPGSPSFVRVSQGGLPSLGKGSR